MDPVAAVLFGKTRQAVLSRLFSFPGETVYLRELARLTGISTGSLQKELNQLGVCAAEPFRAGWCVAQAIGG